MSIAQLKYRFDTLLNNLNSSAVGTFASTVESAYEAVVLAQVMTEYANLEGSINTIHPPSNGYFLNQAPGSFDTRKSFKIDFANGNEYYFSADTEVYGLNAFNTLSPIGTLFEADVVVVPARHEPDIVSNFNSYPAPQHLDSVYECKFGKYSKGQLRELLGLRRHISLLVSANFRSNNTINNNSFNLNISNSSPAIPIKMVRPNLLNFFDPQTEELFDLQQLSV